MTRPLVPETFNARLVDARPLGPRVRLLAFERADGRPFEFQAGQWVQLVFPVLDAKGKPVRRSYSVASAPDGSGRFELAVTQVERGVGSTFLHAAQPGLSLEVKGPAGGFTRPLERATPSLFVATGSGVAPFRAMLFDAVAHGRTEPLWLLFGVREPAELLFGDELKALAQRHAFVRLEPSFSRPPPGVPGRSGYVQSHVAGLWRELVAAHPTAEAYVCGVRKMLLAVRDVLKSDCGVERQQLHLESYD